MTWQYMLPVFGQMLDWQFYSSTAVWRPVEHWTRDHDIWESLRFAIGEEPEKVLLASNDGIILGALWPCQEASSRLLLSN